MYISTNSAHSSSLADSSQASSSLISRSVSCPPHQASNDLPDDYVLLATAIVLVQNRFEEHIQCRAILDSASQLNFITTRFANQLQLKTRRSHVAISGIGESALDSGSRHRCQVAKRWLWSLICSRRDTNHHGLSVAT